jgi:hypothetical protein
MFNTLAQATTLEAEPSSSVMIPMFLGILVLAVLAIAGTWKVFQKAGKPGWASIVPVYNTWVLFEITGYPAWISLLSLVPIANIGAAVFTIMANFKIAKLFGKDTPFAVLNVFFSFITMPILGFGSAQFQGASAAASVPETTTPTTEPTEPAQPDEAAPETSADTPAEDEDQNTPPPTSQSSSTPGV